MSIWSRWFGRRRRPAPATAPGERVFAIGDIHGRLDLFDELIGRIERDNRRMPQAERTTIVVLGDFVDRGPDSRAMIRLLRTMQQENARFIVPPGNHEAALLDSVAGDGDAQLVWMHFGGEATLKSFRIARPRAGEDPRAFGARLAEGLGHSIVDWLCGLPLSFRSGDYFFCHAGVRPGVPLDRQGREDLLWIRQPFLRDGRDHGAVVVHGHTVVPAVDIRPNRIAVDTGAYRTGMLSAVCLDGTEVRVLDLSGGGLIRNGLVSPPARIDAGPPAALFLRQGLPGAVCMRWRYRVVLPALAALPLPAQAQLAVDRLWIDFARPADTRADILVRNESKARAYVTVTPQEVIDAGADSEHRVQIVDPEQLGLLVTPNRLVLEPGDLRTIRVVSLNKALQNDRIYRIRIAPQVGAFDAAAAEGQARDVAVKVLSAYDILVTARPAQARPQIVASRSGDTLTLSNTGNSNVLLFDGERCPAAAGKAPAACVRIGSRRIYPGNVWRIPLERADDKVRFSQRRSAAVDPAAVSF